MVDCQEILYLNFFTKNLSTRSDIGSHLTKYHSSHEDLRTFMIISSVLTFVMERDCVLCEVRAEAEEKVDDMKLTT